MAFRTVDIKLLGDKALERKLAGLVAAAEKKIVSQALRKSAKRIKKRIIDKVSGFPVGVVTGNYKAAIKASKVRAGKRKRGMIRVGLTRPAEARQAIQQNALEYGRTRGGRPMAARPHVRPAVDEDKANEQKRIGRDIGAGIVREAKKPGKLE